MFAVFDIFGKNFSWELTSFLRKLQRQASDKGQSTYLRGEFCFPNLISAQNDSIFYPSVAIDIVTAESLKEKENSESDQTRDETKALPNNHSLGQTLNSTIESIKLSRNFINVDNYDDRR